jgi:sporulation protein YlmC with PRC-barrel domain
MKTIAAVAVALTLAASPLVLAQTASGPTTPRQPQWYGHQGGEIRASKLIGARVNNDAGERIGEINEVVLTRDGKVAAVVIGVGGFLGIGEREVAVTLSSLRLTQDSSNNTIAAITTTKEDLKAAPEWRWQATGDATGKGTLPTQK